jgi:uncharacterized damage-inducible protein DinB
MKLISILFLVLLISACPLLGANTVDNSNTMDTLPYYEIPDAPEMYNAATVTARMVDGLGYRYYWATEGLRAEDLVYEPGNDGQSCEEVLEHILGLSRFILRTVQKEIHDNTRQYPKLDWQEQRRETLLNLKEASDQLRQTGDISESKIIFKRDETLSEFPFWNLLNGPLADAIYHTGQIVSYRRTTGNPIHPNVSVFRGKTRE